MTDFNKKIKPVCKWCNSTDDYSSQHPDRFPVTGGICNKCANIISQKTESTAANRLYIDKINSPVLLMQPDPRQVYTANKKASELFGKDLSLMEGHRGGQVFDCIHSYTEAGCGKDKNCENCKIKAAIVDTFTTGNSFSEIESLLTVNKNDRISNYLLRITTEKTGDFALVRIDYYNQI